MDASIIIPVHNEESNIHACAKSLLTQSYPKDKYEILFVDNNSNDKTANILNELGIQPLKYTCKANSYSARNFAISVARGKVIAFIDGDCIADTNWIKNGLQPLLDKKCDMVAGNIIFKFSSTPSTHELVDSVIHLQNMDNVSRRNASVTANFFINGSIFKNFGMFPETTKSGTDIAYTQYLSNQGLRIQYISSSVVYHYARERKELIKKIKRTARGKKRNLTDISKKSITKRFRIAFPLRKSLYRLEQLHLSKLRIINMFFVFYYLKGISFICYIFSR